MVKDQYDNMLEEDRPSKICVDGNGIGKGVHDALYSWGLPSRCIMVSQVARLKHRYFSLRDEMWF